MTPTETLDELERLREAGAAVGWRKGTRAEYVTACYCAAPELIADSRTLRELVDALEKCSMPGCDRHALRSDENCEFVCDDDEHGAGPFEELPYAAILRRVT